MTMPDGLMTVRIEIWPLAADEVGIWLLDGPGAWSPVLPVGAGEDLHAEVDLTLALHGVSRDDLVMVHSTSWRQEGPAVVHTYVAVVGCSGPIRSHWPRSLPVGQKLAETVGRPDWHDPTAAPTPRLADVLYHGLRHLAFLLVTDASNAAALDAAGEWRTHLEGLRPTLAGLYRTSQAA